jgi:hypothetical protein
MVPALADIEQAMRWTMKELAAHLDFMKAMLAPIPPLAD